MIEHYDEKDEETLTICTKKKTIEHYDIDVKSLGYGLGGGFFVVIIILLFWFYPQIKKFFSRSSSENK